jgi:hypothetical protein
VIERHHRPSWCGRPLDGAARWPRHAEPKLTAGLVVAIAASVCSSRWSWNTATPRRISRAQASWGRGTGADDQVGVGGLVGIQPDPHGVDDLGRGKILSRSGGAKLKNLL